MFSFLPMLPFPACFGIQGLTSLSNTSPLTLAYDSLCVLVGGGGVGVGHRSTLGVLPWAAPVLGL